MKIIKFAENTKEMRFPIGVQDFESLRNDHYEYVDKTEWVYELTHSGRYFFLSRPRRFGKSLLVSTLEAYFEGKRHLFQGLAIADKEKQWLTYPVLRLDLSGKSYDREDILDKVFDDILSVWEDKYGSVNRSDVPGIRFGNAIEAAYRKTGRPAVVLIDEYDKPIVDNLDNPELCDVFRRRLQGFYSVLKAKDAFLRFGFLTGVTKMGKVSVFSSLNNLNDISMDSKFIEICGITDAELHAQFDDAVLEMARFNQMDKATCYARLKEQYDGYHFRPGAPGLYNPFSLLKALYSKDFQDYWFETGTPAFLMQALRDAELNILDADTIDVQPEMLTGVNASDRNPIPLLYQSGYLTIKGFDPEFNLYQLGFPNREVERGFLNGLIPYFTSLKEVEGPYQISQLTKEARSGHAKQMMERLTSLFADTSYQIQGDSEKDFQYALHLIFKLMGLYTQVEYATSDGRIDIVMQTADYIYLIEVKMNGTPEEALDQIERKGYAHPFAADRRRLFRIGINFSSRSRKIDGWKIA